MDIIQRLERLKVQQPDQLSWLKSPDLLISALKELDSIVEMKTAKEAICLQLEYIITKKLSSDEETTEIFDDHMLHTVVLGSPGTGKTLLGKSMAKIWHALGILKGKRPHPEVPEQIYRNFTLQYEAKVATTNLQIARIARDLDVPVRKINKYVGYGNTDSDSIHRSLKKQQIDLRGIINQNQAPVIPPVNSDEFPFKVTSRVDFVAGYTGQTAIKTQALLNSCIGGVLFIDEAYSLINGDRDSFGMEALTELNRFMSEHPNEIIVIFAGYKNLLEETIFKAQPGLKRRCTWTFEVESYTGIGLASIFNHQLGLHGWTVDPNINLIKFFNKNKDKFMNYGGDTNRLIFYCKLYHMHDCFINLTDEEPVKVGQKRKQPSKEDSKVITEKTLLIALENFLENKASKAKSKPPFGMYI